MPSSIQVLRRTRTHLWIIAAMLVAAAVTAALGAQVMLNLTRMYAVDHFGTLVRSGAIDEQALREATGRADWIDGFNSIIRNPIMMTLNAARPFAAMLAAPAIYPAALAISITTLLRQPTDAS